MIIYKKYGLNSFPQPLWWIVLNPLLTLFFLVSAISFLIIGGVIGGFIWFAVGIVFYLYANRNARPVAIELKDNSISITCFKYFSVYAVDIANDDMKIELYDNKYFTTNYAYYDSKNYLYFSTAKDKNLEIELRASFHELGKILDSVEQQQKISLGNRELNFVARYRNQVEEDKTPRAKFIRTIIPFIIIILAALIIYECRGA